jgi:hypothetical protein
MEESRPATAAPEQTAVQEKPQRKRRRVRVPTSVLVTVLVAGLSVWIAPAFARQWDDRQKARELQAEVADQIGIAVAQTAVGLGALVESTRGPQDVQQFRERWLSRRLRIDARLRAYFPPPVLKLWAGYVTLVGGLTTMALTVRDPDLSPRARRESVGRMAARLHTHVIRYIGSGYVTGLENPPERTGALRRWVSNAILYQVVAFSIGVVSPAVLAASPRGFRTTRRDLLRDLLP